MTKTVRKSKDGMTTIQIQKSTAMQLQMLGHMGETYDAVIRRLVEDKGVRHGDKDHEFTGFSDHKEA